MHIYNHSLYTLDINILITFYIDDLVEDCSISCESAVETLWSCTKVSIYTFYCPLLSEGKEEDYD